MGTVLCILFRVASSRDRRTPLSASPQICREAPLVWLRLKNYSKILVVAKNSSFTVMEIVECAAGRRGVRVEEEPWWGKWRGDWGVVGVGSRPRSDWLAIIRPAWRSVYGSGFVLKIASPPLLRDFSRNFCKYLIENSRILF